MIRFRYRFWCRSCEDDPHGCWDGGPSDWSDETYATKDEAEDAAEAAADGAPWDCEVKEEPNAQ